MTAFWPRFSQVAPGKLIVPSAAVCCVTPAGRMVRVAAPARFNFSGTHSARNTAINTRAASTICPTTLCFGGWYFCLAISSPSCPYRRLRRTAHAVGTSDHSAKPVDVKPQLVPIRRAESVTLLGFVQMADIEFVNEVLIVAVMRDHCRDRGRIEQAEDDGGYRDHHPHRIVGNQRIDAEKDE